MLEPFDLIYLFACGFRQTHQKLSLQWRHNGRDGVSNHQPHHYLLNRLFKNRSKKTSKLLATGLCAQMASNVENVSIWWRHYDWPFFKVCPQNVHIRMEKLWCFHLHQGTNIKSLMKMSNNTGPYGTPFVIWTQSLRDAEVFTLWKRMLKW